MDWLNYLGLEHILTTERLVSLARAGLTLLLGYFIARLIARGVARLTENKVNAQQSMLTRRLSFYIVMSLVLLSVLNQLGIQLGVLLGAAGILTVAVGFASQTSASNLISGLFLMAERPFVIDDVIMVDDVVGVVLSIDLLAIKIRKFDNSLVRIPNENIIKSRLTNLTHFPIRRIDIPVGVAYKENVGRVRDLLMEIASENPLCLDEPAPQFFYEGYGESSLDLRLGVWAAKENFLVVRNDLRLRIKEVFDREGIEIPFPHRSLYAGSMTEPFRVQLIPGNGTSEDSRSSTPEP